MKFFVAVVAAAFLFVGSSVALSAADTTVAPHPAHAVHHPRRKQVRRRIRRQNKRITAKVKAGEMTHAQAHALRKNDKKIHAEEKDMASQNGGHLTKQEQGTLNQQLNQNSKDIKNNGGN